MSRVRSFSSSQDHVRSGSGLVHSSLDAMGAPRPILITVASIRHMIMSAGRSAGCPTTGWYQDSFRMLKLPRYDSARVCRSVEVRSLRRLARRDPGTVSNGLWYHGVTLACRPADQPAAPPPGGVGTASGCSNSRGTIALARVGTSKHARSDGSCRRSRHGE